MFAGRAAPRGEQERPSGPARRDQTSAAKPITGTAACCARTASGQAAAAPPTSEMKSRRFTVQCFPVLPTERIAHLSRDCRAAGF
jgi:hypothetical protein